MSFIDPDNDVLEYSISMRDTSKVLPVWVFFNTVSRRIYGIPLKDDVGLL